MKTWLHFSAMRRSSIVWSNCCSKVNFKPLLVRKTQWGFSTGCQIEYQYEQIVEISLGNSVSSFSSRKTKWTFCAVIGSHFSIPHFQRTTLDRNPFPQVTSSLCKPKSLKWEASAFLVSQDCLLVVMQKLERLTGSVSKMFVSQNRFVRLGWWNIYLMSHCRDNGQGHLPMIFLWTFAQSPSYGK